MTKKLLILPLLALCMAMVPNNIKWEYKTGHKEEDNVKVDVHLPWVTGPDSTVAALINNEIIDQFKEINPYNPTGRQFKDIDVKDLAMAVVTIFRSDNLGRGLPIEYEVNGKIYQRNDLVSVYMFQNGFTGGAHGNEYKSFQNFEASTGRELALTDFISDTTALRELIIKRFRIARGYKGTETKAQTGMFVDIEDLNLPKNIGLTNDGLTAIYNRYEVAPYSYGDTKVVIPFGALKHILKTNF